MFKTLTLILVALFATFNIAQADFEPVGWQKMSTYLETSCDGGCDVLINGTSKYLNFGSASGSSGYGVRDNAGTMEFKNSGGAWAGIAASAGAQTPWSSAIDGAGYSLTNAGRIVATHFTATSTTATSTFRELSFTNATGTNLSVTGSSSFAWLNSASSSADVFAIPNLTSAIMLTNGNGLFAEYAGTSCTNQFVRSLSALGAGTCATVGTADVVGLDISDDTNLAVTYPITLTGDTVGFTATSTWIVGASTSTTSFYSGILQALTARFTNITATGTLAIPNSTDPNPSSVGQIAINTTQASSSIRYYDGTAERSLFAELDGAFNYSTSTATAGTTTIVVSGPIRDTTYTQFGCISRGATVNVQLGDGTASTTMVTSATGNLTTFTTLSSNNTFTKGETRFFAIGTWSGTGGLQVTCSYGKRFDAD